MTDKEQAFWQKVKRFPLDEAGAAFPFSARLAKENGWTAEYTLRAMLEYKRFIFLICHTGSTCAPSDPVDQVWHLHLLYTRSYWIDFCRHTLQQDIHHGPTRGGQAEGQKHENLYANTLALYRETFRKESPADIWPEPGKQYEKKDWLRIARSDYYLIKKPFKT
ncbi:hypothetical protein AB9P05_12795 [Roseivirga sp. BDSF3-8]|uniref:glycine-rich domain-containing protein n=1 Tax=Roseivirga sp. BDSF3-8 TaxID=3241598 RepID=UPI003531E5A8